MLEIVDEFDNSQKIFSYATLPPKTFTYHEFVEEMAGNLEN